MTHLFGLRIIEAHTILPGRRIVAGVLLLTGAELALAVGYDRDTLQSIARDVCNYRGRCPMLFECRCPT